MSMRLPWSITSTSPDYNITWTVAEPTTVPALTQLDFDLTFTGPNSDAHYFDIIFEVVSSPVGADAELDVDLAINGDSFQHPNATGQIAFPYVIGVGMISRDATFSIILYFTGAWEFSFVLVSQ